MLGQSRTPLSLSQPGEACIVVSLLDVLLTLGNSISGMSWQEWGTCQGLFGALAASSALWSCLPTFTGRFMAMFSSLMAELKWPRDWSRNMIPLSWKQKAAMGLTYRWKISLWMEKDIAKQMAALSVWCKPVSDFSEPHPAPPQMKCASGQGISGQGQLKIWVLFFPVWNRVPPMVALISASLTHQS